MTSGTTKILPMATVLAALKTALEGVEISGQPAFGTVALFDLADWEAAVRRLVLSEDRVCLVLYAGEQFDAQRELSVLTVRRSATVELLMSDYRIEDTTIALVGDEQQPGALGLLEAVLPAVTGVLVEDDDEDEMTLDDLTVYAVPAAVERMFLGVDEQERHPGRAVLSLTLRVDGAYLQTAVGRSEVLP